MCAQKAVGLVAVLAVVSLSALAQEVPKGPVALLRASFDQSANADEAKGAKEAKMSQGVKLVPGRKGKGLYIAKGERCVYQAKGNFNAEAGAVHFWFSSSRDLKFQSNPDDDRYLFCLPIGKSSMVLIYIDNGVTPIARLRGEDVKKPVSANGPRLAWKKDEWHHVCMTWDMNHLALYLDGKLAQKQPFGLMPHIGDKIDLGFRRVGSGSIECADGTFDDLVILDGPVTPEQVAALVNKAETEAK